MRPTVFIASSPEGRHLVQALGSHLETDATIIQWTEGAFHSGLSEIESISAAADKADFAVFVFSSDDTLQARENVQLELRPNQIFELGFFAGRIGWSRILIIAPENQNLPLPSDLSGLNVLRFQPALDTNVVAVLGPIATAIRNGIVQFGNRDEHPINYYSCFISYADNDKDFAIKLYEDLQEVGVRCWLDANELKPGDRIHDQINRAIQIHDKLLLILSRASVDSAWVRHEVTRAYEIERARNKTVLFPVRIDDAIFDSKSKELLDAVRERHIGDFRSWKDQDDYQRAFSRLIRDLTINMSVESEVQE